MEKKLYRIPSEGKIAGVCAGLAEYFAADVTVIRVLAVIGAFATDGALVIIYLILALILPVQGREHETKGVGERVQALAEEVSGKDAANSFQNWAGAILILVGVWLTLRVVAPEIFVLRWDIIWSVALVGVGIAILITGRNHNG